MEQRQKYNKLTAIKFSHRNKRSKMFWLFRCDCGVEKVIRVDGVISGHTKSCGCLQRKHISELGKNIVHGMCRTRFHNTWNGMKQRCIDKNLLCYKHYGGRGIKCFWKSFENFRDDMYESYLRHVKEHGEKQTTIDRIDNNGNYEPNNCRWATLEEQQQNKRRSIFITHRGKTRCLKEWAKIVGIKHGSIRGRFYRGWSTKRMIETPIGGN